MSDKPYTADAIRDHVVQWFLQNYESVEENTPRDSGEWVYIWGEPVDAREELDSQFGGLFAEEMIEAAAKTLEDEHDVWEWVPVPSRDADDDEPPLDEESPTP
jgi:hypothetical protein